MVDFSDPLVQQLVQDKAFLTAVQTSQLHTAASAAVRLLRVRLQLGRGLAGPGRENVRGRAGMLLYGSSMTRQQHVPDVLLIPTHSYQPIPSPSPAAQSHFAASGEFKRPPDRRAPRDTYMDHDAPTPRSAAAAAPPPHFHHHNPGAAAAAGRPVPGPHVVHRQLVEPRHREALRCMRLEVLGLEDVIPWNSVRRTWKTKVRPGVHWRLVDGSAVCW